MDSERTLQSKSLTDGRTLNRPIKWEESLNPTTHEPDFLLPVGTVTLVLADIEGSTHLWESDPELMKKGIARYDAILAESIARHGGVRPRDQGEGDSFVAAFGRARDAVSCAIAIQMALKGESWEGPVIKLRIALHTGDVQLRDEGNYVGQTINRCARLRSIGHGGQTLLSQATYELVAESLPEGSTVRDLGVHRLKDLARPEHVYQLSPQRLDEDFPPLRSLDVIPNNLPVQLTSFVGRRREIGEIKRLIDDTRLVTLTGSGGCGKTRLALQVAADLTDGYTDGVWLVDLARVTNPGVVAQTLAAVFSLREEHSRDPLDTISSYLAGKKMIIVLDNCEHLVEACADLTRSLLERCPSLTFIATSREPLGVPGESPWRVPSMSIPVEDEAPQIDALTQYEAVQLFIDRATRTRPGFEITNENAPAVAQICHRLDGVPLAIELAAARVRVLSPQQISDGLTNRFHLLTGGSKTVMPRQQTLRGSVDWSYFLLSGSERSLLERLSVFSGFTLEAAQEVCSGEGIEKQQILELLSQLVDKSLVAMEEIEGAARYKMLETIRQYAADRLAESAGETLFRTQHRDYYLSISSSPPAAGDSEKIQARARALRPEVDNLRAALRWSKDTDEAIPLMSMAAGLTGFWNAIGRLSESRSWLETALSKRDELHPLMTAQLLLHLAVNAFIVDDITGIEVPARESLVIFREHGVKSAEAWCLIFLAWWACFVNRHEWRSMFDEAFAIASEIGDAFAQSNARAGQGYVEFFFGSADNGEVLLQESLRIASKAGLDDSAPLLYLCIAAVMRGDLLEASSRIKAYFNAKRSLETYQVGGLIMDAWVLVLVGDYGQARSRCEEALALAPTTTIASFVTLALHVKALIDFAEGRLADAEVACQDAIAKANAMGVPRASRMSLPLLSEIRLAKGEIDSSRADSEEAITLAQEVEFNQLLLWANLARGRVARAEEDLVLADQCCYDALQIANERPDKVGMIDALELLAGLTADREAHSEAARIFAAAQALRESIGYVRFPSMRKAYESDLANIRVALAEEKFNAAWNEGAAMSQSQVVANALKRRGTRKRPSTGWQSLTPTEVEIVKLVAQGLTNPQIGERLFVSPRTIQGHLGRIFAKLGISSRSELAAEAARGKV